MADPTGLVRVSVPVSNIAPAHMLTQRGTELKPGTRMNYSPLSRIKTESWQGRQGLSLSQHNKGSQAPPTNRVCA